MASDRGASVRKLVKRKEAGKTLQAKFADVYGLIAEVSRVAEGDIDRLETQHDALNAAFADLETLVYSMKSDLDALKRPWWRVW